jgi:hypothetical protein
MSFVQKDRLESIHSIYSLLLLKKILSKNSEKCRDVFSGPQILVKQPNITLCIAQTKQLEKSKYLFSKPKRFYEGRRRRSPYGTTSNSYQRSMKSFFMAKKVVMAYFHE